MQSIVDFLYMVDDMLWGTPMVVIVLGTGIFLSLRFGFSYQRKLKFNIKNTFGNMTSAGEGVGTVSSFRAACTGLANTVGTGNISGVATAIVSGGPGALVWMWVSAFFGMSTKACEIILGQRYREHYKNSIQARQKLAHAQLLGPDLIHGADDAAQHMVQAAIRAGALDGRDVARLAHHADAGAVARHVLADRALVVRGVVEAAAAKVHLLLHLQDGMRQATGLLGIGLEEVIGDALGRLGADAREPAQLIEKNL